MSETVMRPLDGIYAFNSSEPEDALLLFDGPMEVAGSSDSEHGDGRVWLRVVDGLDLRWDFDGHVPWEPVRLRFDRHNAPPVDAPARVTSTVGTGYIDHADIFATPSQSQCQRSGVADQPANLTLELEQVLTHWFNVPAILPASALKVGNNTFAGRWVCEAEGWRLTLDQRQDHADAMRQAHHTGRSTMTHVGKLERTAGVFSVAEAQETLHAFQVAISFAVGAWVAPALPVGYTPAGERVWEEWANWRCTPPAGHLRWWNIRRSQDLTELCAAFLRHWGDPQLRPALRHAAFHSISASSDRATLEAKVMLAQAGIEYLAWVTNVLEGSYSARKYKPVPTEEKLETMLSDARIPTSIPTEFTALKSLIPPDRQSGPQAITWLRNKLVHPKNAAQPYSVSNALTESWLLSRDYLDLLILNRIGYSAEYLPHRSGGWAFQSQPVPWAPPSQAYGAPHAPAVRSNDAS